MVNQETCNHEWHQLLKTNGGAVWTSTHWWNAWATEIEPVFYCVKCLKRKKGDD